MLQHLAHEMKGLTSVGMVHVDCDIFVSNFDDCGIVALPILVLECDDIALKDGSVVKFSSYFECAARNVEHEFILKIAIGICGCDGEIE